jgi:hypothetical protein
MTMPKLSRDLCLVTLLLLAHPKSDEGSVERNAPQRHDSTTDKCYDQTQFIPNKQAVSLSRGTPDAVTNPHPAIQTYQVISATGSKTALQLLAAVV